MPPCFFPTRNCTMLALRNFRYRNPSNIPSISSNSSNFCATATLLKGQRPTQKNLRTIAEWWKMVLLPKLSVFSCPFQLRAMHKLAQAKIFVRDFMIQNGRMFSFSQKKIPSATSSYEEKSHVISKSTGSCIL